MFRLCPQNYTCMRDIGENPNFGYTSFDHFGWALLTSVQLVTMDFWEDVYFHVSLSVYCLNTSSYGLSYAITPVYLSVMWKNSVYLNI